MLTLQNKKTGAKEVWRLIDLGLAEPLLAQTFYEAVAQKIDQGLSPNTIILVQPSSPYVCVGFHQEVDKEVNLQYCRDRGLPIIRRGQGGGTVFLDSKQIFYQVITRESKVIPLNVEKLFETLLKVTVFVYRQLGLPAEFKALNDVIVNGRKISGNGAGKFGEDTTILVGNIILDIDYDSMGEVLKVPSEKFRDKLVKSMRAWVTSLKRELDYIPPVEDIKRLLVEGYEQILGIELVRSDATTEEWKNWEKEVQPRHLSTNWLQQLRPEGDLEKLRAVKIAEGVRVIEVDYKAKKLIRTRAELVGTHIVDITISGDFFMIPKDALKELELTLKGASLNRKVILRKIQEVYTKREIQTPGITPQDFTDAIMKLKDLVIT
jgi:lipoate-protein ligase A